MHQNDAKANRPSAVMKVERVVIDLELLERSLVVFARWSNVYAYNDGRGAHSDQNRGSPGLSDDSVWQAKE